MRAEAAVEANAALDAAEENLRAEAKADADPNADEDSEETPLKRKRVKVVASMRKPLRKKDFILTSTPELEDEIPKEEEAQDDVDEGMFDVEGTEDLDAPFVEDLSDDAEQEQETVADVLRAARAIADEDENFMDNVLLG
ncbi:hypothetical protein M5689_019102 [Euphorbia peplus]|nr:hypothetical protein M5689_019102 [Euphorbia peplus]